MRKSKQAKSKTARNPKVQSTSGSVGAQATPTFMDHVYELRNRLFAIAAVFLLFAALAYPYFDKIANIILAPLGKDYELVYLTPGGAFSFIIQVCLYVGLIFALPAIIYNVYRFIMPAVKRTTIKTALFCTIASFTLAIAGILFAYYVSLPAALYFLTGFDLYHINPMLTIDSYFSFIITYMIAGALLFQIPLLMLIINGANPLNPKGLMKHQGKILLASFIIAAIISPTPDALNQTLLASPMVVMYQAGIIAVWVRNRKTHRQPAVVRQEVKTTPINSVNLGLAPNTLEQKNPIVAINPVVAIRPRCSIDGIVSNAQSLSGSQRAIRPAITPLQTPTLTASFPARAIYVPKRQAVDGFFRGGEPRIVRMDEVRSA